MFDILSLYAYHRLFYMFLDAASTQLLPWAVPDLKNPHASNPVPSLSQACQDIFHRTHGLDVVAWSQDSVSSRFK
jgi:hypothetical protein